MNEANARGKVSSWAQLRPADFGLTSGPQLDLFAMQDALEDPAGLFAAADVEDQADNAGCPTGTCGHTRGQHHANGMCDRCGDCVAG